MASVNKVILLGNCGRDPEIRYMPNGEAACNVSIATSSKRKDKTTGEAIEDTQWHRVQFYGKLAEIAGQYLKKGNPVYIEGRLKYGKFTNKDGVEQHTTDIVAMEMQLMGARQERSEGGDAPTPQARPQQQRQAAPAQAGSGFDDMDDDIPF